MAGRKKENADPKTDVSKRLQEFWGAKNFKEIAKETGFSNRNISAYYKGDIAPSAKLLTSLAAQGADVKYILTGKRSQPETAGGMVEVFQPEPQTVPVIARAAADNEGTSRAVIFQPEDVGDMGQVDLPEYCKGVEVIGDSMAPLVLDGQIALISRKIPVFAHPQAHQYPSSRYISPHRVV